MRIASCPQLLHSARESCRAWLFSKQRAILNRSPVAPRHLVFVTSIHREYRGVTFIVQVGNHPVDEGHGVSGVRLRPLCRPVRQ
jgi:hypothetical protein